MIDEKRARPPAFRRRPLLTLGLGCSVLLALAVTPPAAADNDGRSVLPSQELVSEHFENIRDDPGRLTAFLREMPKGGDLHNHLSGAVATEVLIELAAEDGLCIMNGTSQAVPPPCPHDSRPAEQLRSDEEFRQRVLRAWSMEDFTPGETSGHDHFFDTFGKFGEVTWRHTGRLLAEVNDTAATQRQFYQELMVTPASEEGRKVAAGLEYSDDPAALLDRLTAGGKLEKLVRKGRDEADEAIADFRAHSRCGTPHAAPGCDVEYRFISQVSRAGSPAQVFTQMAVGMALAERDPRFVATNLVQPEDWEASLRNYRLQMRWLRYLRSVYPKAHLTLHAGELVPGLVKPEDLTFHINDAIHIAGAERIGHGVSIRHENGSDRLLATMAERRIPVEVPLTSNEQILGVRGDEHPFPLYRERGVPVVLATDDQGVSRSTITDEYVKAVQRYDLTYHDVKELARASLEYAFLSGSGIWQEHGGYEIVPACAGVLRGANQPTGACADRLRNDPKGRVQWRQEAAFHDFEQRILAEKGRP